MRERAFAASVAIDIEGAAICNPYLDLVAFLEIEHFHDGCGQSDRQAVAPLCYAHLPLPDLLLPK